MRCFHAPLLIALLSLPAAAGEAIVANADCTDPAAIPKAALDAARRLKVVLGHQSVGGNLLEGLSLLAERDPERYAVERADDPGAGWFDEHAGWVDFCAGENEDPQSKLDHFRRKLTEDGLGKKVDVASVKLCWIDFAGRKGEAKRIFEAYRDTLESLEKEFPKVKFVWWTAPLKTEPNPTRAEFNGLMRAYCRDKGKILFDIADIESREAPTKPSLDPRLLEKWAEDEGHLNDEGRVRAAAAWWWLMTRLKGN